MWGLTPRQWRSESPDDRALMLAFVLFESTLEARRFSWREEKREREEQRKSDAGTFTAMKRRLGQRPPAAGGGMGD